LQEKWGNSGVIRIVGGKCQKMLKVAKNVHEVGTNVCEIAAKRDKKQMSGWGGKLMSKKEIGRRLHQKK
jgi:hypothetical protein